MLEFRPPVLSKALRRFTKATNISMVGICDLTSNVLNYSKGHTMRRLSAMGTRYSSIHLHRLPVIRRYHRPFCGGAPEIDMFEAQVSDETGQVSQSAQWAVRLPDDPFFQGH